MHPPQVCTQDTLPPHPCLLRQAATLLNAYALWFRGHPQVLPAALNAMLRGCVVPQV